MNTETTGFTLWFTGMQGAGKSTLANHCAERLRVIGRHVEVLDNGEVRENLVKELGSTREDRDAYVRRLGYVCKLLTRNGAVAVAAELSPTRSVREEVRKSVVRFIEVFVDCPVEVLMKRDKTGHYHKAMRGEIRNFIGITEPYEPPAHAEAIVYTDRETLDECGRKVFQSLLNERLVTPAEFTVLTGFRGRRQQPGAKKAARPHAAPAPRKGERKVKPVRAAARTARPKARGKRRR
jgi:adenylylsulfate kinase